MRPRQWNKKGVETIIATLLLVTIVVVMSVMVYAWSVGIFGGILPVPPQGKEILTLENQAFNPTNVTLFLRNTGTATTTLVSYYVQDLNGDEYARTSWTNGPTITPTSLGQAQILIPPACSPNNCKLTGSSFSFQPGNSYTISLVTAKNTQLSFTLLW